MNNLKLVVEFVRDRDELYSFPLREKYCLDDFLWITEARW